MKPFKVLLSLISMVAVFLATTLSTQAIGFNAEEAYNSVFVIYSGNALGSGYAVGKDCIVTNAHVIEDKSSVMVRTYGGEQYQAQVIGLDENQDIAVLYIEGMEFPYLQVANDTNMNIGDDVYAIGAPKSMSYTLTKGVISNKEREINGYTYIQIDAAINEGNSGGPLLNDDGCVIGMNTLKMSDSEGIGLAIPISRVCAYLKMLGIELDENGNVSGNISGDVSGNAGGEIQEPSKENDDEQHSETYVIEDESIPLLTKVVLCVAIISIIGNIVLAIILIYQKHKNINLKYDPRERTDFEIDILE